MIDLYKKYRKEAIIVALLFLWGFLIRVLFFQSIIHHPISNLDLFFSGSDMYGNLEWVNSIAKGDLWGKETWHPEHSWMLEMGSMEQWYKWWKQKEIYHQAPLYPYWLFVLMKFFNGNLLWVRFFQHIIGIFSGILIYFCGRKLFGYTGGIVSGFLALSYYPFLCFEFYFLRDFLAVHLFCWFLLTIIYLEDTKGFKWHFFSGILLGLCILARENFLILVPFSFLWIKGNRFLKKAGTFYAGLLVMLIPLFIRNIYVGAPFYALSNRLLESVIEGFSYDSDPAYMCIPPSMKHYLHSGGGSVLNTFYLIVSDYSSMAAFIKRIILKVFLVFFFLEPYNNINLYFFREQFQWMQVLPDYPGIIFIALTGLAINFKQKRISYLLGIFVLTALSLIIGPVLARYRLVLIPFYLLWAGFLFQSFSEKLKRNIRIYFMVFICIIICSGFLLNKTLKEEWKHRDLEVVYSKKIEAVKNQITDVE